MLCFVNLFLAPALSAQRDGDDGGWDRRRGGAKATCSKYECWGERADESPSRPSAESLTHTRFLQKPRTPPTAPHPTHTVPPPLSLLPHAPPPGQKTREWSDWLRPEFSVFLLLKKRGWAPLFYRPPGEYRGRAECAQGGKGRGGGRAARWICACFRDFSAGVVGSAAAPAPRPPAPACIKGPPATHMNSHSAPGQTGAAGGALWGRGGAESVHPNPSEETKRARRARCWATASRLGNSDV